MFDQGIFGPGEDRRAGWGKPFAAQGSDQVLPFRPRGRRSEEPLAIIRIGKTFRINADGVPKADAPGVMTLQTFVW